MKRLFLKMILTFLGLGLLVTLLFLWLILTPSGLKSIVVMLPHFIPGKIKIDKVEGRLYDTFSLKNITYRDQSISFNLNDISIDWNLKEILFHQHVYIKKLQLEGLNIISVSENTQKSQISFSSLKFLPPSHWEIDQLLLNNIAYKGYDIPNSVWRFRGDIKNEAIQYTLEGNLLKGNLRSHGDMHFGQNLQWQMTLDAKNPYLQAHANIGNMSEAIDGKWKIAILRLSDIWAALHGSIESEGNLTGTLYFPKIDAYLKGHKLYLSDSTQSIENLSGAIQGTLQAHTLHLTLQKEDLNLTFALQGSYEKNLWKGDLKKLAFNSPMTGKWQLKRSAEIELSLQKYVIHHFVITNPYSLLLLEAVWEKDKGGFLDEVGTIHIPALNITLNKFTVHAEGNTQQIRYRASAFSRMGQLSAQGRAYLGKTPSLQATIQGQNFLAINTPLYKVWVSPLLQLEKKSQQWILKGNIFIPKANIVIPDYRQNAITLPKETIIENAQTKAKPTQNMQFYSDVLLRLGDNVHFQAEGLFSQLEGQVRLQDAPNHPTLGVGKLIILQGKYKAYGQKLAIHEGQLIFNHSTVTNPNLQIQASKQVTLMDSTDDQLQKVEVGVQVTNTLEEPRITLFSLLGSLSQSDILSYILFEKPLDAISPLDAAMLLRATSTTKLGTSGFEEVMKGIKNTTGFQKFSIESVHYLDPATASVKESTSLVLGKALSPKLYLSYSVGLMNPINILTLKYFLSKKWTLQSSSSQMGAGLDIFYAAEKN